MEAIVPLSVAVDIWLEEGQEVIVPLVNSMAKVSVDGVLLDKLVDRIIPRKVLIEDGEISKYIPRT